MRFLGFVVLKPYEIYKHNEHNEQCKHNEH